MYNYVINEHCVSFDTAKLLKELGYNEPCIAGYRYNVFFGAQIYKDSIALNDYNDAPDYMEQYSVPTYDNVREWLEKVYHMGITVKKNIYYIQI